MNIFQRNNVKSACDSLAYALLEMFHSEINEDQRKQFKNFVRLQTVKILFPEAKRICEENELLLLTESLGLTAPRKAEAGVNAYKAASENQHFFGDPIPAETPDSKPPETVIQVDEPF